MSFSEDDEGARSKGKSNPFDWNEDEESLFMKLDSGDQTVLGVSPRDVNAKLMHDFLKQSRLSEASEKATLPDSPSSSVGRDLNEFDAPAAKVLSGKQSVTFSAGNVRAGAFKKGDQDESPLTDVVNNKPQVSTKDYNTLQAQLLKCKQTIEILKHQKWKAIPPQETVQRIILGKPYSLEVYKSLSEKQELLDFAIKWHDGNAILTVTLFLQRTLKPTLFLEEIRQRPVVLQHYIRFLKENQQYAALSGLYTSLHKMAAVALLQFERATQEKDMKRQLSQLREISREINCSPAVGDLSLVVQENSSLLEKQIRMEAEDSQLALDNRHAIMRSIPRTSTIPGKSLITTLTYSALYHYDESTSHLCHPTNLRNEFKLTPKQYEWAVVPSRAKLNRWADITDMLMTKKWLKSVERSAIGFDELVQMLQSHGAPVVILSKYLMLVDNTECRLKLAHQFHCHDVAIDTIVTLRDKTQLENYRLNVLNDNLYRQKINDLLNNSQIKWK